jgi:large subunit ribosomal protein L25
MDNAVLEAKLRDKMVKAKTLRRDEDLIPVEFYGHGVENQSLVVDHQTFRKLYRKAGENTIIDLKVDGGSDQKVLVQSVDWHPVTGDITHVELINVRMDEEVTTHVAIKLEGLAPAVKELAGTLVQNLDEIEIRCLPDDLIHEVTLNVESLVDFHSALHVSDIAVPEKITVLTDPETTVATVSAPRAEEPEEVEEADVSSVEVAGEKKEEGAEEGGE